MSSVSSTTTLTFNQAVAEEMQYSLQAHLSGKMGPTRIASFDNATIAQAAAWLEGVVTGSINKGHVRLNQEVLDLLQSVARNHDRIDRQMALGTPAGIGSPANVAQLFVDDARRLYEAAAGSVSINVTGESAFALAIAQGVTKVTYIDPSRDLAITPIRQRLNMYSFGTLDFVAGALASPVDRGLLLDAHLDDGAMGDHLRASAHAVPEDIKKLQKLVRQGEWTAMTRQELRTVIRALEAKKKSPDQEDSGILKDLKELRDALRQLELGAKFFKDHGILRYYVKDPRGGLQKDTYDNNLEVTLSVDPAGRMSLDNISQETVTVVLDGRPITLESGGGRALEGISALEILEISIGLLPGEVGSDNLPNAAEIPQARITFPGIASDGAKATWQLAAAASRWQGTQVENYGQGPILPPSLFRGDLSEVEEALVRSLLVYLRAHEIDPEKIGVHGLRDWLETTKGMPRNVIDSSLVHKPIGPDRWGTRSPALEAAKGRPDLAPRRAGALRGR